MNTVLNPIRWVVGLGFLVACLFSTLAGPAEAQGFISSPPPVVSPVDANGVNLVSGTFNLNVQDVSIGQNGEGGLAYARTFVGNGWTDNQIATVSGILISPTISFGGASEKFGTDGNGGYINLQGTGSTLSYNATTLVWTYTSGSGVVVSLPQSLAGGAGNPSYGVLGRAASALYPDGKALTYTYNSVFVDPLTYYRLQSVNNNFGYQLKYTYASDTVSAGNIQPWLTVATVTGINNAVDYCSPIAFSCTGFTKQWPSATYATITGLPITTTETDALGRVTRYTYDNSGRLIGLRRPSSATDTTTITYNGSGQVASVSNEVGTWSYGYVPSGSTETTTVNDPLTHTRVVVSNLTTSLVSSDTDGLNRTTNFVYDTFGRLTEVERPEGDYTVNVYDGRGNITEVARLPVPGSGLSNIDNYANFDEPSCTLPAKCNKPNSTQDGRGYTTTYTYDPTYGVLLSATSPTPSGSNTPQTRLGYTSLYAWYKNSSGTIVQAATPVHLLTSTSSCATLPPPPATSCPGTSDEVKGTIVYGTAGVANNLGPTAVSSGAGDGSLTATKAISYTSLGDVETVQGALGPAQQTLAFYDAARQVEGIVSPNPGAGEGLAYPAVRYTYNLDGQPTLIEQGTVVSQSQADFANFITLQEQAIGYDSVGRKTQASMELADGSKLTLQQYTYDNANNLQCSAVRMNSATFDSPPASACTLGTQGSNGPDFITFNTYDNANELTKVTNAYGTAAQADYTTATYSDNGYVQTIKDANNNLTTVILDGFDRTSKIEYPLSAKGSNASDPNDYEAYTYDANSNPLTVNRRPGGSSSTTITLAYDSLNRPTLKSFPAGTEQNVYFGYDLLNRTLYAHYGSAGGVGDTYVYDALSRTTSATQSTATSSRALSYQYDLAGDRTRITWPDASPNTLYVAYVYDLLQRVTQVEENGATSGPGLLAAFTYDNLRRRTIVTRAAAAGASTYYNYEYANWIGGFTQNLSGSTNDVSFGLTYSPAFQVVGKTVSNDAYTYHPSALSKSYVANGLNQYASVSGSSYSNDARGNLTFDGTRTFTYDLENHLLTASAPTAVTLTYDPLGRIQTSTASSATTTFLYDGDMLVGEYNSAGTILNRYVPGPNVDEPLVWYAGTGTTNRQWPLGDTQGSIISWAGPTGVSGATYGYDPYGAPSSWSGSRYRYTGQLMIPEAQVYSYKARVYDPGLGRFLQTDPIGYKSDVNAYAYTANSPVNGTDPGGTDNPVEEFVVTALPSAPSPDFINVVSLLGSGFFSVNPATLPALDQGPLLSEFVVTGKRQETDVIQPFVDWGPSGLDTSLPEATLTLIADNERNPQCTKAVYFCLQHGAPHNACHERENSCNAILNASRDSEGNIVDIISFPDGTRVIRDENGNTYVFKGKEYQPPSTTNLFELFQFIDPVIPH